MGDKAGQPPVAAQKAPVCRRKREQTLWRRSGHSLEAHQKSAGRSLCCDWECRAAASGPRPSASSQSWVGFRALSSCWRRGGQEAQIPGGMLGAGGWDPPVRHFTCWAVAGSVPLSRHLHAQIVFSCTDWVCLYCWSGKNVKKVEVRYKILNL